MANELQFYDALTGGNQVGTSGAPVPFNNLNSPVTLYACTESGEGTPTFDFTGQGWELSTDGGSTYSVSGSFPAVGPSPRKAIKVRQTSLGASSNVTIIHPSPFESGTAPTLSGTLTATPGVNKITLSGPTASDNVAIDHYVIEYGTSTSYGSTQTVSSTSTTFPSTDVTGLTSGIWYFRLKAYDAAGNVSTGLTASANSLLFTNNFAAGEALNTTYLGSSVANGGTASVASNLWTIQSTSDTQGAIGYMKDSVDFTQTSVLRVKFNIPTMGDYSFVNPLAIQSSTTTETPAVDTNTVRNAKAALAAGIVRTGTTYAYALTYWNTSGTAYNWNGSAWGTADANFPFTLGTDYYTHIETNGTQVRLVVADANDTPITASGWVNVSSLRNNGGKYFAWMGDQYNNYYYGTLNVKLVSRQIT